MNNEWSVFAIIFGKIQPPIAGWVDQTVAALAGQIRLPLLATFVLFITCYSLTSRVAPGRHAVLLLGQAGWHISERLTVPSNITIMALPAKCPELKPQENVWQFMRDNWLSNRVFTSYDNIVDLCADAWNRLVA